MKYSSFCAAIPVTRVPLSSLSIRSGPEQLVRVSSGRPEEPNTMKQDSCAQESCFIVFGSSGRPELTRTNCSGPLRIERLDNGTRVTGMAAQNDEYFMVDTRGKTNRVAVKDL